MADGLDIAWSSPVSTPPRSYVCGYCGNRVGPDRGYIAVLQQQGRAVGQVAIHLCSFCRQPTYFDSAERQWPGAIVGGAVNALPDDVAALYNEARRCMSVSAYTTAAMACRKLLMHIAVERGAGQNQSFAYYVQWLVDNHYVPPGGDAWVSQIRLTGNDANHEITLIDQSLAEHVLSFTEMLLRFIYEFPSRSGASTEPPAATPT